MPWFDPSFVWGRQKQQAPQGPGSWSSQGGQQMGGDNPWTQRSLQTGSFFSTGFLRLISAMEAKALADQLPFSAWLRRAGFSGHFPIKSAPAMELPRGRLPTVIAQSRRNFGRSVPALVA
jgi:hypothetical protein